MTPPQRTANREGSGRGRLRPRSQDEQIQEVARGLAGPILHGRLPPGERLPTVRRLMERHGATSQTVQKAFALLKRRGLIETEVGNGSFVAVEPVCRRRVGLTYPWHPESLHRWSLFYDAIIQAVAAVERESDWRAPAYLGLAESLPQLSGMGLLQTAIEALELGGVIFGENPYMLADSGLTAPEFPLPRVGLMRADPKFPHIPAVFFDFMDFFRRAFECIHEAGCRRVGVVLGSNYSRDTIAIVNQHATAYGIATAPWLIQCVPQEEPSWTSNAVQGLLRRVPEERPDALIVIDDLLVAPAIEGCRASGALIGSDLTVVAYCNFPVKARQWPGVHYLGLDGSELLATALHVIERQQRGRSCPPLSLVPARFESELQGVRSEIIRQALAGGHLSLSPVDLPDVAFLRHEAGVVS